MKINRKVTTSVAAVACAFVLMVAAAVAGSGKAPENSYSGEDLTNEAATQIATKMKAELDMVAATPEQETTLPQEGEMIAALDASNETPDAANATPDTASATEEAPVEEEVSQWAMRLMPDVEESLNIRAEGNEEAEVLGKMYKGASADILERGEEWTKITSGSVEGYVKNEYCVFDEEAEALANELGTVYATANESGLRVRAEAGTSEDIAIVDVLEEGRKLKVDTAVEAPEGWVAVISNDTTAYVSAEYVTVELELGKAISIQEELEAIRKAEEERKAKEAAKAAQNSGQTSGGETTQRGAVAATYDEVTLLAALIQCEAGGETYDAQLGVGSVVMNRLRSGWAGSIYDVIYQSGQFAPAMTGSLERRLANGVSGSCVQAAQEAINGVDNVNGALYFKLASSGHPGTVYCCIVFY